MVLIPPGEVDAFLKGARTETENLRLEFGTIDPGMTVDFTEAAIPETTLDGPSSITVAPLLWP